MVPPVRLTVCDFYLAAPKVGLDPTLSEFRGGPITQVPILRIFGSTLTGTKVCLHVHGVFPYLYIPFEGNDNPDQLQYLIANALDKSLNISLGQTNSCSRHVFKIVLVSGIPFYGFHGNQHQFFKIYLFNPNLIKKTADLLLNGTIMGRTFQPHESHIPFTQQFMVDYNLQGMHLVHCANMTYRRDPLLEPDDPVNRDALEIPAKVSTCEIEADILAEEILNRYDNYSSQHVVNPGLAALWEDEHQRRRIQGRDTQPTPLATQQRNPSGPSSTEEFHRCRLQEKLAELGEIGETSFSSTQSSSVAYPAEAPDGLMNASFVEQHSSRLSNQTLTQNSLTSDHMDTQDVELLDLLDSMANSQSSLKEGSCIEEVVTAEEIISGTDSDAENDMNETIEMTQPFVESTHLQHQTSSDEDSLDDLFDSSTTLHTVDEQLKQLDGVDDAKKLRVKRRRLGARGSVSSERSVSETGPGKVTKSWLLKELDQVLEMPSEALEQLQQGILNDLQTQPEVPLDFPLTEETQPPTIEENILYEDSKLSDEQKASTSKIDQQKASTSKIDQQKASTSKIDQQKASTSKIDQQKASTSKIDQQEQSTEQMHLNVKANCRMKMRRSTKSLGTKKGHKKVKVQLELPKEAVVNHESIQIMEDGNGLNISFEVEGTEKPSEPLKLKHCSVRLERIQNTAEIIAPVTPEEPIESAELKYENTPSVTQEKVESNEDDDMERLVLLSSDDDVRVIPHEDTIVKTEPVEADSLKVIYFQPSKRKRLSLIDSPPKSPKDKRAMRKMKRDLRMEYQGMSITEIQVDRHSMTKKNSQRHPPKGPDKGPSKEFLNSPEKDPPLSCDKDPPEALDTTVDDSFMNSFYDMTVPPCEEFLIEPLLAPPSALKLAEFGLQPLTFQPPFYSDPKDGEAPLSSAPCHLPAFSSQWFQSSALSLGQSEKRTVLIEPLLPPPRADQLVNLQTEFSVMQTAEVDNLQQARAVVEENHLSVMHLEIVASNRGKLLPDPELDPVCCMFFLLHGDRGLNNNMGVIAVKQDEFMETSITSPEYKTKCQSIEIVENEIEAFTRLVHMVQFHNPDILMGHEIEMQSWGYLVQRASRLGLNLSNLISRVPKLESHEAKQMQSSQGAIAEYSELRIQGRIVLNLWRLLRQEIAVQDYSLENTTFILLHRRLPHFSGPQLLTWWNIPRRRFLVSNYVLSRLEACHQMLDSLDLLGRTSELARLFGIQFYEVFSRGSQFRVESMMLRLAKPKNFVPLSPSVAQRANMRSAEFIPLVMEPQSTFYQDPVAVLDFQSLYPSVIIAHNICFSTCLGRVEFLGKEEPFEFGCNLLKVNPHKIKKLDPFVSPNGVAFVPKSVRLGILPAMLAEILETRLMVKQSMKHNKKDEILTKVLHARQLGLKLIANVTYGYTAANFSGRMPCTEVGDSVVAKGREILERAIRMVNDNQEKWGGEVVYGDTDSMFVLFRGKTRQQAFDIAEQIAEVVTLDNPTPIKLKMEKVYQPCILQTKKRYVGFMYENKYQEEPVYEAKGIETVRRDGCPAVAKLLEECLRIVFSTKDLSLVKKHTVNYFQQVLLGTVSLRDFIFAKEFRGFGGYRPGACVPALQLARQWVQVDRRAEPRRSERVPYVIVSGAPGLPLFRLVRSPMQLLEDPSLRLNAEYYLSRALVPPLARCFNLLGVDVAKWLADMPRRTVVGPTGKGSIAHFFATVECAVCRSQTRTGVCSECRKKPQMAVLRLYEMIRKKERAAMGIETICGSCCGRRFDLDCDSLACPVMYTRKRDAIDDQLPKLRKCLEDFSF